MKEYFEDRKLEGQITIKLDKGKVWVADKYRICAVIQQVVTKYAKEGYKLSLRQLYYQLVSMDEIPNHLKVYKKVSSIVDDMRYSGHINWDSIEDRGRVPHLEYSVGNVPEALKDTADYYKRNRQEGQENLIEIWTEKDAISGILKPVTNKFHVRLCINKGYSSSTAMYRSYARFVKAINEGKKVVLLYFGDHDPSGLDMVRDIEDRITKFICTGKRLKLEDEIKEWWDDFDAVFDLDQEYHEAVRVLVQSAEGKEYKQATLRNAAVKYNYYKHKEFIKENDLFKVVHIGLTMDQIEKYNPPPNPAKSTDPRHGWYKREHGDESWEVDAIEPSIMQDIVETSVLEYLDLDKYNEVVSEEEKEREEIREIIESYNNKK